MSRNPIARMAAFPLLVIAACAEKHSQNPADGDSSQGTGISENNTIAWFDGSVDEAFAEASSSGKPIFLYWGAGDAARQQAVDRMRAQMDSICAGLKGERPDTCDSFLQLPQAA